MRMEDICGDRTLPSCSGVSKEEQVNENTTSLLTADSNISCDSLNAAVPDAEGEKLDKDYCMEATKLILDLGKWSLVYC